MIVRKVDKSVTLLVNFSGFTGCSVRYRGKRQKTEEQLKNEKFAYDFHNYLKREFGNRRQSIFLRQEITEQPNKYHYKDISMEKLLKEMRVVYENQQPGT